MAALPESSVAVRPRTIVIRPARSVGFDLRELLDFRELLFFLAWRDVKVRYKQTALGVAWALLQPLVAMLIFTILFSRVAGIRPGGIPYPVFVYAGLIPWTFFAASLSASSNSVVANTNLVTKVYFPRLIIPMASVAVPLVDFALSFGILAGLMGWYRVVPGWEIVFLPAFMLFAFVTALGIGLLLAAVNVRYRDVPHAIPFLLQVWMFASPVIYSVSFVPERWRWLLGVNPMTAVIEGFRWSLLGQAPPGLWVVVASGATAIVAMVLGLAYFRRVERYFADVI